VASCVLRCPLGTRRPNLVSPSRDIALGIGRGFGIPMRVRGSALARRASSSPHRLPPAAIALICLVVLFALQGCARLIVSDSKVSVLQPPTDLSMTIRTLGADHRFSELSPTAVAERLRALHAGEPSTFSRLSCGGAGGAFGAGAMAGLTVSGSRPNFAVVTGVSAGALVAPYAFLGPEWTLVFSSPSRVERIKAFCNREGSEHSSALACIAANL